MILLNFISISTCYGAHVPMMVYRPSIQGQADELRPLVGDELLDLRSALFVDLKDSVEKIYQHSHHQYLSK